MINHSKHDFGGVTSFESISQFCCDRCCSVIRGPGGSRNVGNLVRGGSFCLREGGLLGHAVWSHSHQRPASLKILKLRAHPMSRTLKYTSLGCAFAPWRWARWAAGWASFQHSWRKLFVLFLVTHELLADASSCQLSVGWVKSQVGRLQMGFTELGRTTAQGWEWDQIISGECSGVSWPAGVCLPLSS